MNDSIATWTDGRGVWHARVPMTGSRYQDALTAQRAIADELAQREGPRFDPSRVLVSHVHTGEDTIVYREV